MGSPALQLAMREIATDPKRLTANVYQFVASEATADSLPKIDPAEVIGNDAEQRITDLLWFAGGLTRHYDINLSQALLDSPCDVRIRDIDRIAALRAQRDRQERWSNAPAYLCGNVESFLLAASDVLMDDYPALSAREAIKRRRILAHATGGLVFSASTMLQRMCGVPLANALAKNTKERLDGRSFGMASNG